MKDFINSHCIDNIVTLNQDDALEVCTRMSPATTASSTRGADR